MGLCEPDFSAVSLGLCGVGGRADPLGAVVRQGGNVGFQAPADSVFKTCSRDRCKSLEDPLGSSEPNELQMCQEQSFHSCFLVGLTRNLSPAFAGAHVDFLVHW